MTLSQKVSHYAKFVVALLGFVVILVTSFVASFGSELPAGTVAWINSAVALVTAVGVFITKNTPVVEQAVDLFDGERRAE